MLGPSIDKPDGATDLTATVAHVTFIVSKQLAAKYGECFELKFENRRLTVNKV